MIHKLTHRWAREMNRHLPSSFREWKAGDAVNPIQFESLMDAVLDENEAFRREDEAAVLKRMAQDMRRR